MKNYLVFDLGGTTVKYGVLSETGNILDKGNFPTPQDRIETLYDEMEKVKNSFRYNFSGVALSCPGAVDSDKGVIGGVSAISYIHGPNIKNDLENKYGLKVHLENDANCAALAEVWIGEAKENNDVVFIVLGTGVGGAIVKDKHIHKGKNLQAGEFGIMYFETEKDIPATWGYVSIGQLVLRAKVLLGREITGIEIFNLAEAGNNDMIKLLDDWYKNIAKGIFTIQYVYDPEKIIIGGAVSERSDLVSNINRELKKLLDKIPVATVVPNIALCRFKNDANLIGALYNFIQRERI